MLAVPSTGKVMINVIAESVAVKHDRGIAQPADVVYIYRPLAIADLMPLQPFSTAQHLARGKPTEISDLNGHNMRNGAEHGMLTPAKLALSAGVLD